MSDDANIKARDNEIVKYFSASFDRLSTATAVIGFIAPAAAFFIAPAAALMSNPEVTLAYDYRRWIFVVISAFYWLAVSYGLHRTGKVTLARGFK